MDEQNLDVCKVALKRKLLLQLHKSGQPRDKQQHLRQKMSRISHLPLQVPQGDNQEEIILTPSTEAANNDGSQVKLPPQMDYIPTTPNVPNPWIINVPQREPQAAKARNDNKLA